MGISRKIFKQRLLDFLLENPQILHNVASHITTYEKNPKKDARSIEEFYEFKVLCAHVVNHTNIVHYADIIDEAFSQELSDSPSNQFLVFTNSREQKALKKIQKHQNRLREAQKEGNLQQVLDEILPDKIEAPSFVITHENVHQFTMGQEGETID